MRFPLYALGCLLLGHFALSEVQGVAPPSVCEPVAQAAGAYEDFPEELQVVSAHPERAVDDLLRFTEHYHKDTLLHDILGTLELGRNGGDTKAFLEALSRSFARQGQIDGGRPEVVSALRKLESLSSTLRALRVRLVANMQSEPARAEELRAKANEVQTLYARNQNKIGRLRLALAYDAWNRAQNLGLVDLKLVSGEQVDRGIATYQYKYENENDGRRPNSVKDAPALVVRVKYDHAQLLKKLRSGEISEELYFALTFARRTNAEDGTTAYGTHWYPADGVYGRTSVVNETGNAPIRSLTYEGKPLDNGGGWVRATPPVGSFMTLRLEGPKHVDKFTRDERIALMDADGWATQGIPTRPEFHWVKRNSQAGPGTGEEWIRAIFGEREVARMKEELPFASYDQQGLTILFGGENGVPAQKWNGGSSTSDPVGKFITENFRDLRDARLFFETSLDTVPGPRGKLKPVAGGKPKFSAERPGEPDIAAIGEDNFRRALGHADELIAGFESRIRKYIKAVHDYDKSGEAELERATYLDLIRFRTELGQLKAARARAGHALTKFTRGRYVNQEPPPASKSLPGAHPLLNDVEYAELKAHLEKFPGSHLRFDAETLDLISDLELRREYEIARAKQTTRELSSRPGGTEFDYVIFDGLVGTYLGKLLIDRGVPPERILFVGETDSAFLQFAGISSFETANETLKKMGVNLGEKSPHIIQHRPEGIAIPSTTAPAEANLNAVEYKGARHAHGRLSAEPQPDGTNRYFVTDPETGTRAEVKVAKQLIYGPGLAYPDSVGDPRVLTDKEFYAMAKKQVMMDQPIIPPGKSVLVIGSGGASASVEKLLVGTALRHLEEGQVPGKITVIGSLDSFNNNPRFRLDEPRAILGRNGLFDFVPGRVDSPKKESGTVQWHSVEKLPNGRYRVTPYKMMEGDVRVALEPIEVDYVIDSAASVSGKDIIAAEAKKFAPGFVIRASADGAFMGLSARGKNPITVIGPAAAVLGAKDPRANSTSAVLLFQARLAQGNGEIDTQPTSPIPEVGRDGKLISDIGPFSAQSLAMEKLAEVLEPSQAPLLRPAHRK